MQPARPLAVVITPAARAADRPSVPSPATSTSPATLRPAPSGGDQASQAGRPVPPIPSTEPASTNSTASSPRRTPVAAAAFDDPRNEPLFGINPSMLLAAVIAVFILGVAVMVVSGRRPARRTH